MDGCDQLVSDMALCHYGDPRASDDQVTDGVHKLVFVMCSGDPEQVLVSEILLQPGTDDEPLDLGMEQLVQASVGLQPLSLEHVPETEKDCKLNV
jgi:hypothetical protein